jgi:hypothetical protein
VRGQAKAAPAAVPLRSLRDAFWQSQILVFRILLNMYSVLQSLHNFVHLADMKVSSRGEAC